MTAVTSEKIFWIAVPWAVGPSNTKARVSVLVSPRLEGDRSSSAWSLAPDGTAAGAPPHCSFLDWPSILGKIKFVVRVGDPTNPGAAKRFEFPAPNADRGLWLRLFGKQTPVTPFRTQTFTATRAAAATDRIVRSYSPRAIADLVRDAYVAAVVGQPEQSHGMKIFAAANADGALQDFLDFHAPPHTIATAAIDKQPVAGEVGLDCERHQITTDDRGRLIVVTQEVARSQCFVLPPLSSDTPFVVTFRNESSERVVVQTTDGSPIDDIGTSVVVPLRTTDDDEDVVFRAGKGQWRIEHVRGLDFHEAVSALSPYPQLMRKLGLLFDLELPFTVGETVAAQGYISVAPKDDPRGCAIESRSISPWTAFATSAAGGTHVFAARPENLGVAMGLLRNDTLRHHVEQLDIDGAAFQMHAHANAAAADSNVADVARDIAPPAPTQPPVFRHGGFALIDEEMETEVLRAVQRRTKHENDVRNGIVPLLFADDLVQGYRVDTARDKGRWRSLCERRGTYFAGHDAKVVEGTKDDEGHVSLIADQQQNGELRISRAVFRWDGWSLAVQRPMKAINDGGDVVENTQRHPHATFPLKVEFAPVPQSLERLRFGSGYEFRVRSVDVAGNALDLKQADAITLTLMDGVIFRERDGAFDRFEPVDAPVLTAVQPPGRNETADVLVIRQDDSGYIETRRWLVLPPKVSELIAEKHGVLDRLKESGPVWDAIVARDSDLPGGTTGAHDPEWLRLHAHGAVPYFADPLARGAALQRLPGDASAKVPFFATNALEARPFLLSLHGDGTAILADGGELSIALPAGRTFEVNISSYTDEHVPKLFPTWRWIAKRRSISEKKEVELATSGQLTGVTPPRPVKMIHAVQRPVLPDDDGIRFFSFNQLLRNPGDVSVRLEGELAIDVPSTGRIDLQAEWTEMVDDPTLPDWHSDAHAAELFPSNVGPNGEAASTECKLPTPAKGGFPLCGTQTFKDTHYRRVRYRAIAISRFLEFYPEELVKERANVSRLSADVELDVPNTALPALPEIAYVVPAFEWSEETPDARTLRTTRASLFRVYLKRGWFSSGDHEMAAVVLAPDNADMTVLGELVTEWGVDPIWKSRPLRARPRLTDFSPVEVEEATETPCIRELRRSNVVATLRREKRPDGTTEEVTQPVDIAAYPVALDTEKNLLYFDVAIDTHGAYFPFVRLALARYQPCSIAGKHLSPVVRAAFTQVTPQRAVTVRRATNDDYEVIVAGPSYEPHEPVAGRAIGKRATVEITLERKEPGMGKSEMDWFPITQSHALAVSGNSAATLWTGTIKTRWLQRDGYHRIVLREYEHFYTDPSEPDGATPSETRRLVFAYAMRLDGI